MEANPGSAEAVKFSGFREAGINRLSIGVQSFQDEQLQALGRIHNAEAALAAVTAARAAGFSRGPALKPAGGECGGGAGRGGGLGDRGGTRTHGGRPRAAPTPGRQPHRPRLA